MAELRRIDPAKATRGCLVVNSLVERAKTAPAATADLVNSWRVATA